ncbi:hypothetical protein M0R45_026376 [Rubus argutus]|uniref:6-phosphogluconate dehydrogenase NADP-binding domain-containing protein n=1 Tax=Rubus argutus TaxID=59490 RepID=A0AAW1WXA5_RUBAR
METPYPNPITPSQTRIGWIGIGLMGAPMASHLISAGYSLTIYARTPSEATSLQSQGARLARSPFEVAQCSDVVFTIVGHPPDVRQVILEANGVLLGLNPNGVTVDMTTNLPALAREISSAARAKDCWAVDAPVSGADVGAREGKLGIFAGGDAGVVKWLTPLFDVMGVVTYMGEAGCGQSCKIANNIVAGKMIERDFRPGGFAEYIVKDLGMGLNVVEETDDEKVVVLPGAALCKQVFTGMVANGDAKLGIHGLITVMERLNGKSS